MKAISKSISSRHRQEFSNLCRTFSEHSIEPMISLDGASHIVRYINPAYSKLVDEQPSNLIGQPFSEALANPKCLNLLDRVYQSGEPGVLTDQEHSILKNRYWSYSCWAIHGRNRRPAGVMVQVTDSTESIKFRKRLAQMNQSLLISSVRQHEMTEKAEKMNEALRVTTQAKNQFLASMSHEIRTPLNAIMGFSELLSLPDQSMADRKNYSERISRHAHILLRLIDDILDLSKVEAGKLDIDKIPLELPELLSDIQNVMGHAAAEKGIALSMAHEGDLPRRILSDSTRLKQILTNIIGNAIKFTMAGSVRMTTKVDAVRHMLSFVVRDTGIGMTSEQATKIFQPFSQGDSDTTRKFGGTGLGLELSRRLAMALGGNVLLLDTQSGAGSVFEITVALEGASYEPGTATPGKPQLQKQLRLDGVRVLLAEDGPDNQVLIKKYLNIAGAHCDLASDGEEAVTMSHEGDYDIILMDIQMPNVDGYQATSRLRALGCTVPIVALTAHAMRNEVEKCRLAGCNAHLAKPIGMLSLWNLVHRMVAGEPDTRGSSPMSLNSEAWHPL